MSWCSWARATAPSALPQGRPVHRPGRGRPHRRRQARLHLRRPGPRPRRGRLRRRPDPVLGDRSSGILVPGAVKLADLNGDGIPDLVVANSGSNNVLVYPGPGRWPVRPGVQRRPRLLHRHQPDRHHGGRPQRRRQPDLLVANTGSNDVSVLLGQGSGSSWTMTPGPRIKTDAGPVGRGRGQHPRRRPRPTWPSPTARPTTCRSSRAWAAASSTTRPQRYGPTRSARPPAGCSWATSTARGPGLATLNAGSNDVTLISGPASASPLTQTFAQRRPAAVDGVRGRLQRQRVHRPGGGQQRQRLVRRCCWAATGGLGLSQTLASPAVPSPSG